MLQKLKSRLKEVPFGSALRSILLIVTYTLMCLTSCSCPFSELYKAPVDEKFYEHTIPWEEDWSGLKTNDVDESTRNKCIKLVDKLGQIRLAYMADEVSNIYYKLIDIGEPSIPFLIRGVSSSNLYRSYRCLYPLAMLKRLTIQQLLTGYRQSTKSNYSTLSNRIAFLLDNLYYLDKNQLKDLIDSYTNSTDEIECACLVWRIAHPDCGNRSAIPFLLKVIENEPSWIVYVQARNSLLCLTGLFLTDTDEGIDMQQEILNLYSVGSILFDSVGTSLKAGHFATNKDRKWTAGEQEARQRIVQKWKNWYSFSSHLTTTQWIKQSFEVYTKEIDGIWLHPDDIILGPENDIRLLFLYKIGGVRNYQYYHLFKNSWEELASKGLLPKPIKMGDETKGYEPRDSGLVYRKWWETYGEKIDFIDSIWNDAFFTDPETGGIPGYRTLLPSHIYYIYLLCDPRGLMLLIENIKRLQKHKKYGHGLVFDSNCKATKLAGKIFYEVNLTFDALKNITGQDFGWNWRRTKEEKAKTVEQWEKWVNENVHYLYWSDEMNRFVIDEESKAAGIPTDEYRKTHPDQQKKIDKRK